MSIIVITSNRTEWPSKALLELKKIAAISPTVTQAALDAGKPVFERELFMNDHNSIARQLREVMALDQTYELSLQYYNLQPGQDFATAPLASCHISAEILENMLAAADGEFEDEI